MPVPARYLLASLSAWFTSLVFVEAFASRGAGAILTVVTLALASAQLRSSDGSLSDFSRDGAR